MKSFSNRFSRQAGSALFLDRDGVINRKLNNDYVKNIGEFEWMPHAGEVLARIAPFFSHFFVVTNQQGIGKGLMTVADLEAIHAHMCAGLEKYGISFSRVYYCPDLAQSNSPRRKPQPGMAYDAAADFPAIRLEASLVIGDSLSDLEFGRNAGLHTLYLNETALPPSHSQHADAVAKNWLEIATLF